MGANFRVGDFKNRTDFYVAREQLLHCHSPFYRARQRRGIPVFAPIVPRMQQYQETISAMQMKVKLEAQQTLKVTGKGDGGRVINDMPFGGKAQDNEPKLLDKIKIDNGMIWDLPEDRDMGSVETRTPSGEHLNYMTTHLEAICACVGIPHAIALMLVGGSYSATRGQMLAFEHTVNRLHSYVVDASQRVWNRVISEGIRKGELPPAPTKIQNGVQVSDFYHVEWTHPKRLTLSPLEDQKVFDAQFARGDLTLTSILKQQNKERADVWSETEQEIRDAAERAKRLTTETGQNIPIEYFMNKARPGAGNPAAGTTKPKEEEVLD
jgi:capsid protein